MMSPFKFNIDPKALGCRREWGEVVNDNMTGGDPVKTAIAAAQLFYLNATNLSSVCLVSRVPDRCKRDSVLHA